MRHTVRFVVAVAMALSLGATALAEGEDLPSRKEDKSLCEGDCRLANSNCNEACLEKKGRAAVKGCLAKCKTDLKTCVDGCGKPAK